MKTKLLRESIVIGIIILFLGASVIPNISGVNETVEKEIDEINIHMDNLILGTEVFYPTDDTCVSHDSPGDINGATPYLNIRNEYGAGGSPGWASDGLVKFDISSISKGSLIKSAKLYFYYFQYLSTNPAGRELKLYKITRDWDESTTNWNNQPSYHSTSSTGAPVPGMINNWMEWDVTSDVQDFVNRAIDNYGWKITDENYWGSPGISNARIRAKEDATNKPYLEIEILVPRMTLLLGRIENLNAEGDITTFDAVRLRYIQFMPFSFNTYTSGKEIAITSNLGILTTNLPFGFFSSALLKKNQSLFIL